MCFMKSQSRRLATSLPFMNDIVMLRDPRLTVEIDYRLQPLQPMDPAHRKTFQKSHGAKAPSFA